MKYKVQQKIRVKADAQMVWDMLSKFDHQFYEHIAYRKSGSIVDKKPTQIEGDHALMWEAQNGELELGRYQDVSVSRDLMRVIYTVEDKGHCAIVNLVLEFQVKLSAIGNSLNIYSEIKPIVRDNLLWFKTMVEDELVQAFPTFNARYA